MKNNHQLTRRMGWRGLWLLFAMALGSVASFGQTVTIGTGTTSSYFYGPIYRSSAASSFNHSNFAYLYVASELSSIPVGSTITMIEWDKASGSISGNNVFEILMANNSATALTSGTTWGTISAGATSVFNSSTAAFSTTNGWEAWTLTNPFIYTGGSLQIMTRHQKIGTATAANNYRYTAQTGKAIGYASSVVATSTSTLSTTYGNNRPNIRITYIPGVACSGTPTAGTAVAASTNVCASSPTSISVTGGAAASGLTYTWESSPDNSTWSTISGATSGALANVVPSAGGTYYRRVTTCSNSGLSAASAASAKVNLNSFLNCYCASAATSTNDEEITNVTLGTINNTTACASLTGTQGTAVAGSTADLYSNFAGSTVPVPNLNATQSYNLSFQLTLCLGSPYTNTNKVWIDWNRDGDFLDASEEVFNSGSASRNTTTFNTSIFVPVWVASGQTRMRVATKETTTKRQNDSNRNKSR